MESGARVRKVMISLEAAALRCFLAVAIESCWAVFDSSYLWYQSLSVKR